MRPFSSDEVIKFCDHIMELGIEGVPIAMEILFAYTWNEPEKYKACRGKMRSIILIPGLLTDERSINVIDIREWDMIVGNLLRNEHKDNKLASHLSKEIINACSRMYLIGDLERILRNKSNYLLEIYRDITWEIFSETLLSQDKSVKNNLIRILSPGDTFNNEELSQGIASRLPVEFLTDWCNQNKDKAPFLLAEIIQPLEKTESSWSFTPLAMYLIDNLGDNEEILNRIGFNMGNTSWSGSMVPYYQRKIQPLEKIRNHKNSNVQTWVRKTIEYFQKEIEQEKRRDDEWGLHS